MIREQAIANPVRDRWRSRIGLYAVFLALFSMQATTALHQEQHRLADLTEACAACLHIDQFGGAVATPVPGIAISVPREALPPAQSEAPHTVTRPAWYGRAPPVLT